MSTIDIGKIKIVWKNAWDSSTAYTVDDAVSHSGSSYICIQAGTNQNPSSATAYWQVMASAGTNGTDLTSTLTTRGDIVYKGASALTRLPKGTAGYYLKQGANDPEWAEVASGADFSPNFQAYLNNNQSIPSTTSTTLAFNVEAFDPDNVYNNSTYQFTVPSGKAGKYVIYGSTRKNNFAGTRYFVQVICTGTTSKTILTAENGFNNDGYPSVAWFRVEPLLVGDVLKCEIYHNDSGNRTLIGDKESSYFGAYRLSD